MKTCPPCHQNCNQGRSCPARTLLGRCTTGDIIRLDRTGEVFLVGEPEILTYYGNKYRCIRCQNQTETYLHGNCHVTILQRRTNEL